MYHGLVFDYSKLGWVRLGWAKMVCAVLRFCLDGIRCGADCAVLLFAICCALTGCAVMGCGVLCAVRCCALRECAVLCCALMDFLCCAVL